MTKTDADDEDVTTWGEDDDPESLMGEDTGSELGGSDV